jgi:hypothetical protein
MRHMLTCGGRADRLRKEALASVTTLTESLIDVLNQRYRARCVCAYAAGAD